MDDKTRNDFKDNENKGSLPSDSKTCDGARNRENKNNSIILEKAISPSYVSSCSDSSLSCENDNSEKVEAKKETIQHRPDTSEAKIGAEKVAITHSGQDTMTEVPSKCNTFSNVITGDGDSCHSQHQEMLSNRIQSLESQLAALQLQLSNVLNAIESDSTTKERSTVSLDVPRVHRVSSILLHDLHEVSDMEQELTNLKDNSPGRKSVRDSSPAPNLEYRSYTPTYEEELLKFRKSSRGMSLDNTADTEKKISTEGNKLNDRELFRKEIKPGTKHSSPLSTGQKSSAKLDRNSVKHNTIEPNFSDNVTFATKNHDVQDDTQNAEETLKLKKKQAIDLIIKKERMGFFESRFRAILAFFDSLNLDSRQHDGSATEDIDANMEEFLRVPWRIEELMSFGTIICADAFLHVLTVTPLKFVWSCLCLVCTILNPGKGIGWCRFHRRHLYQFVRVFVIYAVYKYCLSPISIGKMYHWIRGQAMLKLYVLMAMVEVFDRLMCSFGQDALDSLFWNTTNRPFHPRMLLSILVVLGYAIIHSYILFVHVATLNVAMNSADQTLLTLLISGNFAEIKSTVFKKYNKQNLFKIVSSDICERFKLVLFLGLVLLLNCSQGGMNQEMVNEYMHMSLIIFLAEMLCDWIKHSFITKFNFIKSSTYQHYALILAGDITGVGKDGLHIDHTHKVVKRLGFAQIPLACVMARYVAEAVRYADTLSDDGDSNHVLYSIAVSLTRGTWTQVGSMLMTLLIVLLVLKGLLGQCVENRSHTVILFGPEPEGDSSIAQTNKSVSRRQAA